VADPMPPVSLPGGVGPEQWNQKMKHQRRELLSDAKRPASEA